MKSIREIVKDQAIEAEAAGDAILLTRSASPYPREMRGGNGRGLWALTLKEIQRFLKIWLQTIISPLVMTLLFYAVFAVAMGGAARKIGDVPFLQFLIPGLVMMSMAQAAFMSPSVSLILSKLQGNIVDVLMAPLSPLELTIAYALSGLARGLIVGAVSLIALSFLAPLSIHNGWFIFYYAVMGSLMMSLIGLITGVWGRDFDHLGAVQNFIIMPATFLSGSFFSIQDLPPLWMKICFFNPFFFMIDGFRCGFTGHTDGGLLGGMALLLCVNMALSHVAYWMFARGTNLKN